MTASLTCAYGHHPVDAAEPIVWVENLGCYTTRAFACVPCFNDRVPDDEYAIWRYWRGSLRRGRAAALACEVCGRRAIVVPDFWYGVCTPACANRRRNPRRRLGEPDPRPCSLCGEMFTPARRDARFCGSACKQAAYRLRKHGPVTDNRASLLIDIHRSVTPVGPIDVEVVSQPLKGTP